MLEQEITYLNGDGTTADKTKPATHWVDEKDPPIEVLMMC